MSKFLERLRTYFAGTIVYDDEPCQVCGRAVCACHNDMTNGSGSA